MIRTSTLVLSLLLLAACGKGDEAPLPTGWSKAELGATSHVVQHGKIYFSSQPGAEDFAKLKEKGVKTVINLRLPTEAPELKEAETVKGLGMNYVSIPFKGPETLTDAVFTTARGTLGKLSELEPAVIHCKSGNRVGALWYAWRVLDDGASKEDAMKEAKAIGLRKEGHIKRTEEYVKANQK